jgi:hypothetical protein
MIAEGKASPGKPEAQAEAPPDAGGLDNFDSILAHLTALREINLQVEMERYVKPARSLMATSPASWKPPRRRTYWPG